MKADNSRAAGLWQRLKDSAAWQKLRSPQGPIVVALVLVAILLAVYLSTGLKSCTSTRTTVGSSSLWGSSGNTDSELSSILTQIEGAGDTRVLITYDKAGALVGVVVVSEGANSPQVAVKLMRAVQTATGANMDQIEIFVKSK